jgi:A nuclease family of the HNH/ENDO VII superfamily with conserved AHH
VYFEVSVKDQVKINENYKIVQSQVNEVEKIKAEIDDANPVSQFIKGAVDGVKDNLVGTATMIAHPLETLTAIKDVTVALGSLTADDVSNITKVVKGKISDTFTTKDGINSIPYGAGYAVGMLATDIVVGKGVGIALEAVKEIPAISKLLTKLGDLKSLATAKVAEKFSDEAASLAGERARKALATQLYSGIPVDAMLDMAVVAGNKIKNGAVKFADFSKQMVDEFGDKIKPHLAKLHREGLTELNLVQPYANLKDVESVLGKSIKAGDKLPDGYEWNNKQIFRKKGNVDANYAPLKLENGKIALREGSDRLSKPSVMESNYKNDWMQKSRTSNPTLTKAEVETAYKEHRKTVQIHHVMPDEVVQTSDLFKEARKKGIYNLDRIENQRALPNKTNLKPDDAFGHWGSHKGYTDEVLIAVKKVEDELKLRYKTLDKVPTKELKRKIEKLENEFQRRLKDANVPITNRRLSYLPSNQVIGGRNNVRV